MELNPNQVIMTRERWIAEKAIAPHKCKEEEIVEVRGEGENETLVSLGISRQIQTIGGVWLSVIITN